MDILYSFTDSFFANFREDVWDGRETHYSYSLFWCVTSIRKPLDNGGSVKHSKGVCLREKFVFIWIQKLKNFEETDITQTLRKRHYIRVRHRCVSWLRQIQSTFSHAIFQDNIYIIPPNTIKFSECSMCSFPFSFSHRHSVCISNSPTLSPPLSLARTLHLVHLIFPLLDHPIVFGDHSKLRYSTACSSLNSPSFSL